MSENNSEELWPAGVTPTGTFSAVIEHCRNTRDNLFITGRAGTGKSTLLRALVKVVGGEVVVGAPTGIAALHVSGETLHSLFRLPFGLLLDGEEKGARPRAIFEQDNVTLIIDEVSMVRADVMNAIDVSLKKLRGNRAPFGGVRVIAFGDTHQLPPTITSKQDQRGVAAAFGGTRFFNAPAARTLHLVELVQVFRQTDARFIALLNEVRDGDVTDQTLALINSRVGPEPYGEGDAWVWVTATNDAAAAVNRRFLGGVEGSDRIYSARVSGDFEMSGRTADESRLPADPELRLKEGARVIFIRNDRHRRWVNGTTGVVSGLEVDSIEVKTAAGETVTVGYERWPKMRKVKVGKEVIEEEVGSFAQLPVRLGWGVTVHKCQGMTLDRLFVYTPKRFFVAGQTYVALSRAKSFEGLRLLRPLTRRDVFLSEDALGYRNLLQPLDLSSRKKKE